MLYLQAAWEKFIKYMDVEAKFVVPSYKTFAITAEEVEKLVDEKTIGVVCIMVLLYTHTRSVANVTFTRTHTRSVDIQSRKR